MDRALLFFLSIEVKAFRGCAFLAAMHRAFPVSALDVFEDVDRPVLGVLWESFGRRKKILKRYLRRFNNRPYAIIIYAHNSVCVRNGNCSDREIWRGSKHRLNKALEERRPRVLRKFKRRFRAIARFIQRHDNPNLSPVLVIGLEDDLTDRAAAVLVQLARSVWPYEIARNPVNINPQKSLAGADLFETHNVNAPRNTNRRRIASLDGTGIDFAHRKSTLDDSIGPMDVVGYLLRESKESEFVLLWTESWQGITGDSRRSPYPHERRQIVPRDFEKDIRRVNQWLRNVV